MNLTKTTWLIVIEVLLFAGRALGQDYKPYPSANITERQWKDYFDTVLENHGNTSEVFPDQNLIIFHNDDMNTSYAFTLRKHPAHPAWITRQVVERNGEVRIKQIGYFAGPEKPFADLYDAYLRLNDRIQEDV